MVYTIAGFLVGLLIPYMARRFSKFMPSTPAYALYRLVKQNKISSKAKLNSKYVKLRSKYLMRSFGYAIISVALTTAVITHIDNNLWWYLGFGWTLLLLTEIDIKMLLLPDIVTIPLLIGGFVFASVVGDSIDSVDSSLGAMVGYALPVLATLLMLWKSVDAFGGGDIKLLAAIGAWLGPEGVIYTILVSCIVFGIYSAVKRQKAGAFGPSLAFAAVVVLLFLF